MNLKGIIPNDSTRPDAFHQVIFGDELTSRLGHDHYDLERAAAEDHGCAARTKLTPNKIDLPRIAGVDQI